MRRRGRRRATSRRRGRRRATLGRRGWPRTGFGRRRSAAAAIANSGNTVISGRATRGAGEKMGAGPDHGYFLFSCARYTYARQSCTIRGGHTFLPYVHSALLRFVEGVYRSKPQFIYTSKVRFWVSRGFGALPSELLQVLSPQSRNNISWHVQAPKEIL